MAKAALHSHPHSPRLSGKVFLFVLVTLLGLASRCEGRNLPLLSSEWHLWKSAHSKGYSSVKEELYRHVIWQSNKRFIEAHNVFNQTFGYTLAMNEMGDLTEEEYRMQFSCVRYSSSDIKAESTVPTYRRPLNYSLPDMVDWHTKDAVSPVMRQGECCSSYAFSAVGTMEGALALAAGKLTPLSVQNVVDCSGPYGSHGCSKGQMEAAFEYAIDMGGIDTEEYYPYEGTQGKCRFNSKFVDGALRSFQKIRTGDEIDLQSAVALEGPIAMAADVQHNIFRFYQRGVYDEPNCSTKKLTHAMLIVGYGNYNGKDYWLVKNSWGTGWGMSGFVRMARNKSNQCGIASRAYFPML